MILYKNSKLKQHKIRQRIIALCLIICFILSFQIVSGAATLEDSVAPGNMYENGGFETPVTNENSKFSMGAAKLVSTDDVTPFEGNFAAVGTGLSDSLVYSDEVAMESDKTYISSYAVRLAPGANSYKAQDKVELASVGGVNTANVTFYKNGEMFKEKTATVANGKQTNHYAVSSSFDITDDWTQMQAIIEFTKGATVPLHYHIDPAYGKHPACRFDAFYLGELDAEKVIVKNSQDEEKTKTFKKSKAQTISLKGEVLNQLGSNAGFASEKNISWSVDDASEAAGITVEDGVVTIPENTEVGAYTVTATADIETNGIGVVTGTHTIEITEATVKLESLTMDSNDILKQIDFDPEQNEYNIDIPVHYDNNNVQEYRLICGDIVPTVSATISDDAAANGNVIDITQATEIPGSAVIAIKDDNDNNLNEYVVNFRTTGKNIYENGGFENVSSVKLVRTNDVPAFEGNWAAVGTKSSDNVFKYLDIPVETGKKYLSSYAVRVAPGEADYIAQDKVEIASENGANTANVTFYKDGKLFAAKSATVSNEKKTNHYAVTGKFDVTSEWTQLQAIIEFTKGKATPAHFHIDPAYLSHPMNRFDAFYIGELTYSDIGLSISDSEKEGEDKTVTQLDIPAVGSKAYSVSLMPENQLGTQAGLEGEEGNITWELADEYDGISVDNGNIVVNESAFERTISIKASAVPSFDDSYTIRKTFDLKLKSNREGSDVTRAVDVTVKGNMVAGETLKGDYRYYNAKGVAEKTSETKYAWFWADSVNGELNKFENATGKTFTVPSGYEEKYIYFQVTPVPIEGVPGNPAYSDYVVKPSKPEVSKVMVSAGGYLGAKAIGTYNFFDKNPQDEDKSTFRWLRSANANYTEATPIPGASAKEYIITEADIDKYLFFEVTAKTNDDVNDIYAVGNTVVSEGKVLAAKPSVGDIEIVKVTDNLYRVDYKYVHPLGIAEGESHIQWYIDGVKRGNKISQTINSGTKKLSVEITPVATEKPYDGTPLKKEINISKRDEAAGVVTNTDGSGGGFGGGAKTVPVPEKKPEPEVVEPVKHWAQDGIDFVKTHGIMQEPMPGDFCNERTVTRSEFIYYVMKTLDFKDAAYEYEFEDVSGEDYFAGILQAAVNAGIISKDTNFNPNNNISRQEVCKILVLACELKPQENISLDKFADREAVSQWARGYVTTSVEAGLLKGVSETEFLPLGNVTREQTAVILKRIYDYKNGGAALQ